MTEIIHLTSDNFASVIEGEVPVLVDFWAPWCGPCKMISPILEEIVAEIGDRITIAKLNVDEHPDIATNYGIRGIPTMILFKGGQAVDRLVGFAPKDSLEQWLNERI